MTEYRVIRTGPTADIEWMLNEQSRQGFELEHVAQANDMLVLFIAKREEIVVEGGKDDV